MLLVTSALYAATAFVLMSTFLLSGTSDHSPSGSLVAAGFVLPILFLPGLLKNGIQFALALRYRLPGRRMAPPRHVQPSISVLIPAWNEEVGIVATIRSVVATGYRPLEIIVINDGSTDRTDEVVRAYLAEHVDPQEPPIRYRQVANGGKAKALNLALSMAEGDIVITIVADSVMHPDFLTRIADYLDRHGVADRVLGPAGGGGDVAPGVAAEEKAQQGGRHGPTRDGLFPSAPMAAHRHGMLLPGNLNELGRFGRRAAARNSLKGRPQRTP